HCLFDRTNHQTNYRPTMNTQIMNKLNNNQVLIQHIGHKKFNYYSCVETSTRVLCLFVWTLWLSVVHQASVRNYNGSGHEGGLFTGQKNNDVGHFACLTRTAQWTIAFDPGVVELKNPVINYIYGCLDLKIGHY